MSQHIESETSFPAATKRINCWRQRLKPINERFFDHVDKTSDSECWNWIGSIAKNGYGKVRVNGGIQSAHRVAWFITYGEIPADMWVLHSCDNPRCVNPGHLWLGTTQDNTADRHRKGRDAKGLKNGRYTHPETIPRGEGHHNAKLSDDAIRQIRKRRFMGVYLHVLAKEYGVVIRTITAIVSKRAWPHVH